MGWVSHESGPYQLPAGPMLAVRTAAVILIIKYWWGLHMLNTVITLEWVVVAQNIDLCVTQARWPSSPAGGRPS